MKLQRKWLMISLACFLLLVGCQTDSPSVSPDTLGDSPSEHRYDAVVKQVIDGDTIHIESPIFGSTKVRLLSIDAAEINYNGASQGSHAIAASQQLQAWLPKGTSIEVQFDARVLDTYDRLLAHIFKEEQHINAELVRSGNAVPYLIYPNFLYFEEFSAAVTKAKQENKGIWGTEQPLELLPYQFRYVEQGGFKMYAGNFTTKEYATPEAWETIPIERRVFFFNKQDVVESGYKLLE